MPAGSGARLQSGGFGRQPLRDPLGASNAQRIFKCLFLDIGLLQHFCGLAPADILAEKDLLKTWRGTLAEQFVGQELLAQRVGSEGPALLLVTGGAWQRRGGGLRVH
ncbi:MAG TPA: DUF4143 domain-containing protein [Candidatus Latescibacteria bacterium]|nr:DUF4143 domain-containing protein [Candidatus Latescibacterota bacterium]